MTLNDQQLSAFWSKVGVSGINECWPWLGAQKPSGYGNVRVNGRYVSAHRLAWELCNFEPPPGYAVMHICDNPPCCNPSHLVLGTNQANNCDKIIKGRGAGPKSPLMGECNNNSKLTAADVKKIRALYGEKTQYQLAAEFGVTQSAVSAIIRRETWRHVP